MQHQYLHPSFSDPHLHALAHTSTHTPTLASHLFPMGVSARVCEREAKIREGEKDKKNRLKARQLVLVGGTHDTHLS